MVKGVIVDLDGTLYLGDSPLPFADEFIKNIRKAGVKILFLTNNSSKTPAFYKRKLAHLNIEAYENSILTSAEAAAVFVKQRYSSPHVLIIGEEGLYSAFAKRNIDITSLHSESDVVVVGYDTELTYGKLKRAALAILNGAMYIGCNPDRTLPSEQGFIPGNGAILAFLNESTAREPFIIGKPNMPIMSIAFGMLGISSSDVLIVGDRYETDIVAGFRSGAQTALVLTGATKMEDMKGKKKPDYIVENLEELWKTLSN